VKTLPNLPLLAIARRMEIWSIHLLVPYARNARIHSPQQIDQIAASILEFGFNAPLLVDSAAGIIAGHGRLLAAQKLGLTHLPVVVLDHLSEKQKRAYIIADNKLAENAAWNEELLASELANLEREGLDLSLVGFSDEELDELLDETENTIDDPVEETIPDAPGEPVTRLGDVWCIGPHRIICGDCRDATIVNRLLDGKQANLVITSPPYAKQREYDAASGFEPIAPDAYLDWFSAVAANIELILAPDGSYLLNIKEHSEEGERHLYVKDLLLAHRRKWNWRFVDEFCWRKTDNGVPGKWNNRFKNAWEPIFHFCKQKEIQFFPQAAGHASDDVIVYSPDNPSSRTGSGLLGAGAEKTSGIAWPSNVIECKAESTQGSHSAPFPRALVEFFLKAFTKSGNLTFDPFLGSGTTIAAAHVLGRVGYGCEISSAYCDVIIQRISARAGVPAVLLTTSQEYATVAQERGVSRPSGQGQVNGPPAKGNRRKAS
jgi:DNA modification methylase